MKKEIHQTWKTANPGDQFPASWFESWTGMNPGWNYRLWTDEDLHEFVRAYYPDFFPVWCSYPLQIMRVDSWRFLMLKKLGGLYVDLDFICLRRLDEWLPEFDRFSCADQGDGILCNAFMWAPFPDSPFLEGIEEAMVRNAHRPEAVEPAGPHFLQRFADGRRHLMTEIDVDTVYPLRFWERGRIEEAAGMDARDLRERFPDAKALSFWTGTWVGQDKSLADPGTPEEESASVPRRSFAFVTIFPMAGREWSRIQADTWQADLEASVFSHKTRREEDPLMEELVSEALQAEWDWLFVGSAGTYVAPERLPALISEGVDLVANESILIDGRPSRRAGYLISREFCRWIIEHAPDLRESGLIPLMKERGFSWSVTPLLRHDSARFPRKDNGIASSASDNPRDLLLFHSSMRAGCALEARCAHEAWHGEIEFHDSGLCCRPGTGDGGFWLEIEGGSILIDWFRWPREVFIRHQEDRGLLMSARHAGYVLGRDLTSIEIGEEDEITRTTNE